MEHENNLEAVILAAGNAMRMRPISEHIPKACLPVGPKMILEHQLGYLKEMDIKTVHIVVGHRHDEICRLLGDGAKYALRIVYHIQKTRLGIAHALSLVRDEIQGAFVLLLGDIYFPKLDIQSMCEEYRRYSANGVLGASIEDNFDVLRRNYSIKTDRDGFVTNVVEKPTKRVSNLKGAGAYLFDKGIFSALEVTPRSSIRNEVELTDAIQLYIETGARVRCAVCVEGDENISTPSDLLRVNMEIVRRSDVRSLLADDHKVGREVRLTNVVVGPRTVIEDNVSLENCVVLPNSTVRKGDNVSNAIYYETEFLSVLPTAQ